MPTSPALRALVRILRPVLLLCMVTCAAWAQPSPTSSLFRFIRDASVQQPVTQVTSGQTYGVIAECYVNYSTGIGPSTKGAWAPSFQMYKDGVLVANDNPNQGYGYAQAWSGSDTGTPRTITFKAYSNGSLVGTWTVQLVGQTNTAPLGSFDGATGSVTKGGSISASGWAADAEMGAPVLSVKMYVDGSYVGDATLGSSRSDVASAFGRSDYTNSGWSFSYNTSGSAVGAHTINAVAWDNGNLSYTMSSKSFTVNARTYTLSTSVSGSGSVSGAGTYTEGTGVTVSASPGTGYYFSGYSGALSGSTPSQTVTMDGGKSVAATFLPIPYSVSLGVSGGSGSTSGAGTYNYGTWATLNATPGTGYSFSNWSDGGAQNHSIFVDGNKSFTASFTVNSYTVTTATSGSGSVAGGGTYTYGQTATLTPIAGTGYSFSGWSGGLTGSANPGTFTVTGPTTVTANFTPNNYTLTTNTSGAGSGSVTAGATSAYGTTQSITATPSTGSTFTGWSGAATGTTNPVTITMDANKTLTANFTLIPYTLTTTTAGTGSGTISGAGTYNYGSTATSTASPSTGSTFTGWSNAATGTTNPVSISMTSAKTLTGTFTLIDYTLTTATSGTGTVTAGGTYPYSTVRTMTATPGTGQQFTGWSGAATGTTNPINITVDSNKTLTATFAPINYTLTTATSGSGSITAGGSYPYGTVRSITATPGTGQTFTGWSGAATGTTNPVNVTIDANKTLMATFTPINYTISTAVAPAAGGSVSGSGTYAYGSTASFTATPATGYSFTGFSGAITSATNPSTLTVTGNATVTANYTINSYTLTTSTTGTGTGSVSGGGTYTYGTNASATATPAAGSTFTGWTNAATGTANPASIAMTANKTLTATFTLNTYAVSTSVVGTGSVTGAGTYNYGATATLTATPGTGYAFAGWSGAITGTTNPQTLTVDAAKSVTATFTANSYTLGVTTVGTGSVTGAGAYTYGQTASLAATPGTGWLLAGFSGAVVSSTSPATVLMDGNKSVTATFVRQTYALNTSVSGSGSITAGGTYNAPDPSVTAVTIIATPTASTRYTGFTGSTSSTIPTANSDGTASLYIPMTMDRSIVANFASRIAQTITFTPIGTHSVSEKYVDLSATSSSGLPVSFTVMSGPGTIVGSRLTFTGTGTISVQASQSGNITYFPATSVLQNASVVAAPTTTLKEVEGSSKINNGEKEEGNFRPGT
jgi:uncharacterized repeat protein (TIGR02543 family)